MSKQNLKQAGLKVTNPRLKILNILENSENRHLRAEDIYHTLLDSGEDVGLATVYRVLTQFESAGLVAKHHFESGHAVYELNGGEHHDHILCVKCNKVEEFFDPIIEDRQIAIAEQRGYKISEHSLYLYGLCADCQTKHT